MIPLLLSTWARAGDLEEVGEALEPVHVETDPAGRPLVLIGSSPRIGGGDDQVAVRLAGGGLAVVEESGTTYAIGDVVDDAGDAIVRARDLVLVSQRQLVSEAVRAAAEDRLASLGPAAAFAALLGPACPEPLCSADRVQQSVLDGFPRLPPDARLGYGDVATDARGEYALLALDPSHVLVLGGGRAPRVGMRHQLDPDAGELTWYRVVSGPSATGQDLSAAQTEELVATLGVGLPDDVDVWGGPRPQPRTGLLALRADVRGFADPAGLAPGVGSTLRIGLRFSPDPRGVPAVVITPFVGAGVSQRTFPATADDRYVGVEPALGAGTVGVDVGLSFTRRGGWWGLRAAPALRADGVRALVGTAQAWSVELPLAVELRGRGLGVEGFGGVELGNRTPGLSGETRWVPYIGGVYGLALNVYPHREEP